MHIINGDEWKTIGEVAQELNVEIARLRDWCNKGYVSCDKEANMRYIPSSEYEKIKKIMNYFDEAKKNGVRKTFKDLERELLRDKLEIVYKENEKEKEVVKALGKALDEIKLIPAMELALKEVNKEITNSIETQLNRISTKNEIENLSTFMIELGKKFDERIEEIKNKDKSTAEIQNLKSYLEEQKKKEEEEQKNNIGTLVKYMKKMQSQYEEQLKEKDKKIEELEKQLAEKPKRSFFGIKY